MQQKEIREMHRKGMLCNVHQYIIHRPALETAHNYTSHTNLTWKELSHTVITAQKLSVHIHPLVLLKTGSEPNLASGLEFSDNHTEMLTSGNSDTLLSVLTLDSGVG